MRILITINHPAHVHFFSTIINYLNARGYELAILATDKENSFKLLDELNIEYIEIGKHQDSLIKKLTNFTIKWFKMFHFCLKFQPDISMGIADFYMAQISKILRFYSLIFTDTEHVKHDKFLTFPFADFVLTPKCFEKRIGKNHITYDAYHELTYLNSNFSPDKNLLGDYGILNNEKYVLIRLVSWNAAHDIGYNGLSDEQLNQLINFLEQEYRIFISSEKRLPKKFNKYLVLRF